MASSVEDPKGHAALPPLGDGDDVAPLDPTAETVRRVLQEMPLMGFGTFIGIEENCIQDKGERGRVTEEAVFTALQQGYRHLDCALPYGNLQWVGDAIRRACLPVADGGLGLRREEIWITSKGSSKTDLSETCKLLGVDYIDLYLVHHPEDFASRESLLAGWQRMNRLLDEGKAVRIGVSNHYQGHLEKLLTLCREESLRPPFANEIELHPQLQEEDFVRFCGERGIRVIAYSPLGYANRNMILTDEKICGIAHRIQFRKGADAGSPLVEATPAQIALAWNMRRGVAVIPKSSHPDRIAENFESYERVLRQIGDEEMEEVRTMDWGIHSTTASEDDKASADRITW